jgi:RNase P subunit RPR2
VKKLLCKPCAAALEARGKTVKAAAMRCEKITCAECGRRRFGILYDVTGQPIRKKEGATT